MSEKEKPIKGTFHGRQILAFREKNKAFVAPLSQTSLYQQQEAQRLTDLAGKAGCSPLTARK